MPRLPQPPRHLDEIARKEYRRMARALADRLDRIDPVALETYAATYSRWLQAEKGLREKGLIVKSPSGYPMQNPYLPIATKAMAALRQYLAEFGATPRSAKYKKIPT